MESTRRGWTIWLTGGEEAGGTRVAEALRRRLSQAGVSAVLLDSGRLWPLLASQSPHTPEACDHCYAQLVDIAAWLTRSGENVIIAAAGHRRCYRAAARARLAPFAEVWVRCPACGAGEADALPPYEPPEAPELVLDAASIAPACAAERIVERLRLVARAAEQGAAP
jgi:adenylylsulfate kinase-like enzyme